MYTESHIKSKVFIIAIGLIVVSALIVVLWTKSSNDKIADNQLMRKPVNESSLEALNTQEDSIREIRDLLVEIEMKFSSQLSDIETLSQQNKNEISELWKLKNEIDDIGTGETALGSSEEAGAMQTDLQQEQENLDAASRQAEYERQLDYFLASQQEDVSWSAQVESNFQAAFNNHMDQIQLNSVTCGDVICKVTANVIGVENISADQMPQIDHIIYGDAKWLGQSMFKMDLDSGEITLYLMRDGVDLPQENS